MDDAGTGYLNIDDGSAFQGTLLISYTDGGGADLFATYSSAIITLEDSTTAATLTAPTTATLLEGGLSGELLSVGRLLKSTWPANPVDGATAGMTGFKTLAKVAKDRVHRMEDEVFLNADLAAAISEAEFNYNVLGGEYARFDLDDSMSIEVDSSDDGFGIIPSDDGGTNSHEGYLAVIVTLLDQLLANEATDSPAVVALGDYEGCAGEIAAEIQDMRTAAIALRGSPDVLFAQGPATALHDHSDNGLGKIRTCFEDAVDTALRFNLE